MKRSRVVQIVVAIATVGVLGVTGLLTSDVNVAAVSSPTRLAAGLLGSNEVPSADPDGTGFAEVQVNTVSNIVCWQLSAAGIAGVTGAHIHNAAAGFNGPIVVDFGGAFGGCTSPVAHPLAVDIAANPANYYINIHTSEHLGGAIRGQLAPAGVGPLSFTALPNPLRVYDSRAGGGKLAANETRNIVMVSGTNGAGVVLPAVSIDAFAAQVVITVTETSAGGYLAAHATGTPVPSTSTINWSALNTNVATGTVVPVDASGRIAITAGPGSATHVIIDVLGYFSFAVV